MEIDLTSFQEGIKEWISEIRRQRFEKCFIYTYLMHTRHCNPERRELKLSLVLKHQYVKCASTRAGILVQFKFESVWQTGHWKY